MEAVSPPPTPSFSNTAEEINYWRSLAEEYKRGMDDALDELDEFQTNSNALEHELETQLQQIDKANRELSVNMEKLTNERDQYRDRLENVQMNMSRELVQLQEKLVQYEKDCAEKKSYIRRLEQTNDDLERYKRSAVDSYEVIETKVNKALEDNAILETEKEDLNVTVQRLKDEARDLRQELAILQKNAVHNGFKPSTTPIGNRTDSLVQTDALPSSNTMFTPATRIAALNMVNDALQKLGYLEFKLTELYRTQGVPSQTTPTLPLSPLSTTPFFLTNGSANPSQTSTNDRTQNRHPFTSSWSKGRSPIHDHSPNDKSISIQN